MTDSKLKLDIRRGRILDRLHQEGRVSVARLSRDLGVTPVTIRSDLTALEARGQLLRIQGGAVLPAKNGFEGSPSVANRQDKQALANVAADMVRDGDTLFINSGTTCVFVAAALKRRRHLNIVTNSLQVAMELGQTSTFQVLLLGGEFHGLYGFTAGEDAQQQLSRYQADWAILSVDGISRDNGIATYHMEEAVINRMMIRQAKKTMIAADHTKLNRPGFTRICGLEHSMILVTDQSADTQFLESMQEAGLEVRTP